MNRDVQTVALSSEIRNELLRWLADSKDVEAIKNDDGTVTYTWTSRFENNELQILSGQLDIVKQ